MKKILITYAVAGEGHKRAAFAIRDALGGGLSSGNIEVKIIDALDYTNRLYRWLYPRIYLFLITYTPSLWGFFYYSLDFRRLYPIVKFVRRLVNKTNTRALEEFLRAYKPEVIISTHFMASEVVSSMKRRNRLSAKLMTCITDFRMHSFWFADRTDFFCVGFKETQRDLIEKWNFPVQKINITGIPINSKFSAVKQRQEICDKLNLSRDLFTILLTGGGFGVGPIVSIIRQLLNLSEPLQILVVCGHNEKLKRQIEKLSTHVKTFGFIDYIDELMSATDIVITKAGGLICSEALSKGLPIITVLPIPGQEARNCKFLIENNAGFRLKRAAQVKEIIKLVYHNRELLGKMRKDIQHLHTQDAAVNVAKFALGV